MFRRVKKITIDLFKRLLFSIISLVLLLPILFVLCVLIFLEDGLPVFFLQERVGKKAHEFRIIKLRTMKVGTPNIATEKLSSPGRYVLKTGKVLRKFHIDELPNLINVIKGDMNLIGYRPSLNSQHDLNNLRMEFDIFQNKPGITGLAQVKGGDNLSIRDKVKYERFYAEKQSLKLDFYILLKTILSNEKLQ
jgi:O-antigen biosynthesis protein WbqP